MLATADQPAYPNARGTRCRAADVILHAGDVTGPAFLAQLRAVAPVHAALGNNDKPLAEVLREAVEVDLAGVAVAIVHDSGPRAGREARLHRRFPAAEVVVFGQVTFRGMRRESAANSSSIRAHRRSAGVSPRTRSASLDLDAGTVRAEIVVVD
jgi:hypothetical protein